MKKVRWGVMSTAGIGLEKVIPAMESGERCTVTAIASRDLEKARAAGERLGIGTTHGSYEALLDDPDVDAVYIPLPNHLHVRWSIEALHAGKHVLCEKPIGMDAGDARKLLEASREFPDLKVMEAFMYRLHPQWQWARRAVLEGKIGEARAIQSFFSYTNTDPGNIRNRAEAGGGGLMDIGCYCISLSRFIFGSEPRRILGLMEHDPAFKVDRFTTGVLEFGNGVSTFTCGTQLAPYQRVKIFGDQGWIEIEIPFNAPPDKPCTLLWRRGDNTEEIAFDICDQYTLQGDAFSRAVQENGDVPTPLEDAAANMRVIDALIGSADEGRFVHLDETIES